MAVAKAFVDSLVITVEVTVIKGKPLGRRATGGRKDFPVKVEEGILVKIRGVPKEFYELVYDKMRKIAELYLGRLPLSYPPTAASKSLDFKIEYPISGFDEQDFANKIATELQELIRNYLPELPRKPLPEVGYIGRRKLMTKLAMAGGILTSFIATFFISTPSLTDPWFWSSILLVMCILAATTKM